MPSVVRSWAPPVVGASVPAPPAPRPYLPAVISTPRPTTIVPTAVPAALPRTMPAATIAPRVPTMVRGPWQPYVVQAPAPKRGRAGWVVSGILAVLLAAGGSAVAVARFSEPRTATAADQPDTSGRGVDDLDEGEDSATTATTVTPTLPAPLPMPTTASVPVTTASTVPTVPVSRDAPQYPAPFRTAYIEACQSSADDVTVGAIARPETSATTSSFCECSISQIEAAMPFSEFMDLSKQAAATGEIPQKIADAMARCL